MHYRTRHTALRWIDKLMNRKCFILCTAVSCAHQMLRSFMPYEWIVLQHLQCNRLNGRDKIKTHANFFPDKNGVVDFVTVSGVRANVIVHDGKRMKINPFAQLKVDSFNLRFNKRSTNVHACMHARRHTPIRHKYVHISLEQIKRNQFAIELVPEFRLKVWYWAACIVHIITHKHRHTVDCRFIQQYSNDIWALAADFSSCFRYFRIFICIFRWTQCKCIYGTKMCIPGIGSGRVGSIIGWVMYPYTSIQWIYRLQRNDMFSLLFTIFFSILNLLL